MADEKVEVRNKETWLGTEENEDGTPVQEVVNDDKVTHEIHNKETWLGTEENEDGTPVKEITPA